MNLPIEREGGKRDACETGGRSPISALTNAFMFFSNRGPLTDDFGSKTIVTGEGIDEESAHLRQAVNRIRQVIEQM